MGLALMLEIDDLLSGLTERHPVAFQWFVTLRGEKRAWPGTLLDGTLIASKGKGVHERDGAE